ncbi:MFS transporter [Kribbella antibiotica]|uniref:MFS transporter n=1 Tax=Kribbella antibiotica TaxID=190195 RepID=A0A4R4ZJ88_9ACTN|nr:MFS transporter [Kribbella antibiotica]TDD57609.1 MFS transporter [Kribbella antibiotica]
MFSRLLVMVLGSGLSMYFLTSVIPLYLAANGSAGIGPGLATGAMMFSAVAVELLVPRMLARWGYRVVLALGVILMGAPALALLFTSSLPIVVLVCAIRGAGLGINVVGAVALIADVTPPHRRGEALGLYGVVVGVPAVIGLPLGVYLTNVIGFNALFAIAAVMALAVLGLATGIPTRTSTEESQVKVLHGLRGSGFLMPSLVFAGVTLAAGISITFLPLAVGNHSLAATALFLQAVTAPLARWLAGRYGDRLGAGRLLPVALLFAALGAAGLIFISTPATVITGATLFGLGFGAAQNLTLTLMYDRAPTSRYGQVSALWNLAYDGGWALGAITFGALVTTTGYPLAFALTAGIVALGIIPSLKASTATRSSALLGLR